MSERDFDGCGSAGEPDTAKPRLLFIVARGRADLKAAIERALEGVPGLEVIENRRADRATLPRSISDGRRTVSPSLDTPESEEWCDMATAASTPTLAIARAPRIVEGQDPKVRRRPRLAFMAESIRGDHATSLGPPMAGTESWVGR